MLATVVANDVAAASSGSISDAVTFTSGMLAPSEVWVSWTTDDSCTAEVSWPALLSSATGGDVKRKGEEVLVTAGAGIAAGLLVVLVMMGTRVSLSGGGGLALVFIGACLVVASTVVVVVASVAGVDTLVVPGGRELRRVVVRTLLD